MQNTFRANGHRTAHRPLCHEYLAPDRTTFSGITSFYTVLWHITLKAICKKQYSSRASNTPPPGQPQVIPHILQNTFRAIVHRTAHRPLCHEYLTPDRTTFSGLSSFYTVLWHITLKAICKITEFLTCLKHATSGQPQVIPHILQNTFSPIGHRTVHRPLCHEYLAPDRTTFSGLSSFYTVLWHITLKAICKKQYSSRASNTPPPGQPQVIPHILQNTFRAIVHRTVHRPLCHEYLAPRSHQLEQPGRKEKVNVRLGYFFIQNGCYFDIFRYLYER